MLQKREDGKPLRNHAQRQCREKALRFLPPGISKRRFVDY
jgi:hypothetical protein